MSGQGCDLSLLAHRLFDAAMSASWRSLASLGESIRSLPQEDQEGDSGLLISSLCALGDGERFIACVSSLAEKNVSGAVKLSLASAHLSQCRQYAQIGCMDKASREAILFGQFIIAAGSSCGFQYTYQQEQGLLSRTRTLPARIASQQQLSLAVKLGRVPRKLCFVLGMHRSGTSALAGLLSKIGLDAPSDLMPGTQDNPKGYFESAGIMNENDRLLANLHSDWRLEERLPSGWIDFEVAYSWRSLLLERFEVSFQGAELPVIKDPRFCVLIDGLDCWLQDYSMEVKFILLVRDPLEVVSSLLARPNDPITRCSALKLWIESVLTAERVTREFDRIIIIADDLFEAPDSVQANIQGFLRHEKILREPDIATSFIDPSLRHHFGGQGAHGMTDLEVMRTDELEYLAKGIYITFKTGHQHGRERMMDKFRHMTVL